MRNRALLTASLAVLALALPSLAFAAAPAAAADLPPPRVYYTIAVEDEGGVTRFAPRNTGGESVLIVPQVPVVLNLTIIYEGTMDHTFTIRSTASNAPSPFIVNVDLPASMGRGTNKTVEFTIIAGNRILADGRNETAQVDGARILFVCLPHESGDMVGHIVIGGAPEAAERPEMGVFLRAYWIGLMGIAATLVLIVISYFVIKGSSRHYRDHHEHIRRGGP